MNEQIPPFDEQWIAAARHREASAAELDQNRRARRREERRERRRRLVRRTVGAVVGLACLAGFAWYVVTANARPGASKPRFVDRSGTLAYEVVPDDRPTPRTGQGARLQPEVTPADPTAIHAFVATRGDGTPITYDPCRPVRFVINPNNAPPDYLRIIHNALTTLSAASGLQLELVSETTEPPSSTRSLYQPDRYGDDWAPVLIAWTDETVIPDLAGDVSGVGGSAWISDGTNPEWYVSGSVHIDTELGTDRDSNQLVLLHELGHVLGLDHVNDPQQVMYPSATVQQLGEGDRTGLANVGAGECAGPI
jgi:hypothetical protein